MANNFEIDRENSAVGPDGCSECGCLEGEIYDDGCDCSCHWPEQEDLEADFDEQIHTCE